MIFSEADTVRAGKKRSLLGSVKTLLATLVSVVHNRIDILATEFEEEKIRLGRIIFLGVITIFFICLALIFLSILVVVIFWDSHRLPALASVTGFYLIVALLSAGCLRHQVKNKPRAFAITLAELRKDDAGLRENV